MTNRLNYKSIIGILKENLDSDTVVLFEKEYQKFNSEERDSHLNEETNHVNTFEDFFINFIDMYFIQPEKMFKTYLDKINKLMQDNIVELENNQENKEVELGELEDYLNLNIQDREKEEKELSVEDLFEETQMLEKETNYLKSYLMSKNTLLNNADSIIKRISKNNSIKQRPKVAHKAYELYVYSLVLEALNSQPNGKLTFKNIKNQSFRPRFAPGKFNPSKYSYVKYDYKGESFEVHLDTQYEGLSKVSHEIDISIINTDIRPNFLHAAIECKYTMTEMDFHYTREFMGMLSDFPQTRNIANDRLRIRADYIVTSASKSLDTTVHKKSKIFLASKSRRYRPYLIKYSRFKNNLFLQNSEENDFKKNIITMIF